MIFPVVTVTVFFVCLIIWHSAMYLLKSIGPWLAWFFVLAAQAVTDWIIARIEAWRWREGAQSEWTGDWPRGQACARWGAIEDDLPGEPIGEETHAREQEHHLVRALRESGEWEIRNSATSGRTRRRVAYRLLARRFNPDRTKPEDKEVAIWCMREIDRIWDDP